MTPQPEKQSLVERLEARASTWLDDPLSQKNSELDLEATTAIRELVNWSWKIRNCLEKQFLHGDAYGNIEAILAY